MFACVRLCSEIQSSLLSTSKSTSSGSVGRRGPGPVRGFLGSGRANDAPADGAGGAEEGPAADAMPRKDGELIGAP